MYFESSQVTVRCCLDQSTASLMAYELISLVAVAQADSVPAPASCCVTPTQSRALTTEGGEQMRLGDKRVI